MTKRTAERAVFVASLAQVSEHLATVYRDRGDPSTKQMENFNGQGWSLSNNMLGAVHGDYWATLPSAKAVGDWEAAALKLVPLAQKTDAKWFATWPGLVRNRVTGKGGK